MRRIPPQRQGPRAAANAPPAAPLLDSLPLSDVLPFRLVWPPRPSRLCPSFCLWPISEFSPALCRGRDRSLPAPVEGIQVGRLQTDTFRLTCFLPRSA